MSVGRKRGDGCRRQLRPRSSYHSTATVKPLELDLELHETVFGHEESFDEILEEGSNRYRRRPARFDRCFPHKMRSLSCKRPLLRRRWYPR